MITWGANWTTAMRMMLRLILGMTARGLKEYRIMDCRFVERTSATTRIGTVVEASRDKTWPFIEYQHGGVIGVEGSKSDKLRQAGDRFCHERWI